MNAPQHMSAAKLALLGRSTWREQGWLRSAEPIAVVGMGCRYPGGVMDPESLWRLLIEGRDAVTEVPPDRWKLDEWYDADPATPGRIATRWGGFLDDIRGFDAAFFDISPGEAERMDPQQRLALEVACEAFEYAGIPLRSLRGTDTGVFFASYHNDYTFLQYADLEGVGARTLTGTLQSLVANRISYALGLHGPSLAIDSACSSSLVATHLACQALRARDCDIALAGGVNVMVTPHITVALSKGGFMSPTGRCRTFDAAADGFVRSEGCGAIVLKRLADAIADGDEVLAVIRGSAVNQDGESTNLTAPNGLAQEALVRRALRNAGVGAEQISLIEAHGTGTELGDPIETDALAAVFRGRSSEAGPCYLGSLKASIGHCEAAAGVGGLIKTVLCLRNRAVPPQVLFHQLSPHVDLRDTPFRIVTETTDWTPSTETRLAGVSSFGVGGTNAHVILEETPAGLARPVESPPPPYVLPLAARSAESLRGLCEAYAEKLSQPVVASEVEGLWQGEHAGLIARAAARRRTHHRDFRVAPVAASEGALADVLRRIAAGSTPIAEPAPEQPGLCFVYSGQGTQWAGMGLALLEQQPVFRAAIERLDAAWQALDGRSLIGEIRRPAEESQLDRTDIAQVGIFAIQVALTELLGSWGIRPSLVIGHSVGELAAACAAGLLDSGDALRAVTERGRVMQSTYDTGRMLSVRATEQEVRRHIAERGLHLSVAALNAPATVVLSGAVDQVEAARELFRADGVEVKLLDVRFGFHSDLMRGAARELGEVLRDLRARPGAIPLISTVTGRELEQLDADYLARNIESTVRFAPAVDRALALGVSHFIELGPHPALGRSILETAEARQTTAGIAFALHRERAPALTLRTLAARVFEWGVDPDWSAIDPGACPPIRLPRYPWAHRPYWLPESSSAGPVASAGASGRGGAKTFPGTRLVTPALSKPVFELDLGDPVFDAFLDHRVGDRPLLPATGLLELLRRAAVEAGVADAAVWDLGILRPIELGGGGHLQVVVESDGPESARGEVYLSADGTSWERAATARLAPVLPGSLGQLAAIDTDTRAIDRDDFYAILERDGCGFGSGFRLLDAIRANDRAAWGDLVLAGAPPWPGDVHPAVVDACAQLCIAVLEQGGGRRPGAFLPWAVDRYVVLGSTAYAAAGRVVLRDVSPDGATFDLEVLDRTSEVLVRIEGWRLRRAPDPAARLRRVEWVAEEVPSPAPDRRVAPWLILHDNSFQAGLADAFAAAGCQVVQQEISNPVLPRAAGEVWAGVIYAAGLGPPSDPLDVAAAVERSCSQLLGVVQQLAGSAHTRLLVLTRGTQASGDLVQPAIPVGAGVWGLMRAVRAELAELRCTSLDLDASPCGDEPAWVVREALAERADAEVAIRDGTRFVARLAMGDLPVVESVGGAYTLVHERPGVLDRFVLRAASVAAPGPGMVTVEVLAAGVNFRDVLTALGEYPGEARMGHECFGRVVGVGVGTAEGDGGFTAEGEGEGERESGLTAEGEGEGESESVVGVGDSVLVLWPGCFGSHVTVPRSFVFPAPKGLDPVAAATIPVAFGTAFFALHRVGALKKGMRVLVHSGAGGVGMAAIQLALRSGAEVYATAGTPEKRALLEELGIAGAFDSRSPGFEAAVLAATVGAGVDIVINSLTGPLIPAGLRCLRDGGVFIELGKREILDLEQVRSIRADVRYVAFDLREEAEADPELLPAIFAEIIPLFEQGELEPLPARAVRIGEAVGAFRRMARAEHIGKIVLVPGGGGEGVWRDGWVVVTGGLGALGLATARWLVQGGARHIALVSRQGLRGDGDSEVGDGILGLRGDGDGEVGDGILGLRGDGDSDGEAGGRFAGLEALGRDAGAEIRVLRADVADRGQLSVALDALRQTGLPIVGVIHSAGVLDDALLPDLTADRLRTVLAPKVAGAWNLHLATLDDPVKLFFMYSAAGPLLSAAGQGSYAAANGFLDALASYRRARGLPAVSVLWGPWSGSGMTQGLSEVQQARWSRYGLDWWTPETGVAALDQLFGPVPEQVLALRLRAEVTQDRGAYDASAAGSRAGRGGSLTEAVRQLPAQQRPAAVLEQVRACVTGILGRDAPVAVDAPLRDLGLDSLGAIELRNSLAVAIGESLPATLAFDHPTVAAIATHLLQRMHRAGESSGRSDAPGVKSVRVELPAAEESLIAVTAAMPEPEKQHGTDPICVVGIGIRAPGGVESPDQFTKLLLDGVDAVGAIPPARRSPGQTDFEQGGFLESVDTFDPEFFGIAPLEAATMDPQQRLLLETVWEALEDAGIAPTRLRGSRSGVFVGIGTADYHRMVMADAASIDTYASTGTAFSVASGRVAYVLGLQGPAISVDTACSSSLVAVHLACQSLRTEETDLALAAGVNLILSPELTLNFRQAGMLSPEGRCRTFDAGADGYVRGEGCGVVVLKRMADARRDGDRILAVLRGSALNQDGRSSGLTAPSGPAQEAVIRAALEQAGLRPGDIGYLEAHGTGTSLGDPIEMQAIGAVFGGATRERPLLVGSAKTNLGHLEAAAGIIGLIKVILALRTREIPPHLHFQTPSPEIPWARLPVAIPTARTAFEPTRGKRRAGVSSFGFSGTNAHVIVEEAFVWADVPGVVEDAPVRRGESPGVAGDHYGPDERPVHLLALSAPHDDALRALAARYADYLEHSRDAFADSCYTANIGRGHFANRLALVATDANVAAQALRSWLDGERPACLVHGQVSADTAAAAVMVPPAVEPQSMLHSRPGSRLAHLAELFEAEAARWLDVVGEAGGAGVLVGSTAAGDDAWYELLLGLARLYVAGANPDWSGVDRGWNRRKVSLPTYPFQRRRFWLTDGREAGPRKGATPRPLPWAAASAAALERSGLVPLDLDLASYPAKWRDLQELTEALGRDTLLRLGAFAGGAQFELEQVLETTGIERLYRPIVGRWLDALARAGELEVVDGGWRVLRLPEPVDLEPFWSRVDAALANDQPLLRYVRNAVTRLESVLTGRVSPLETLFPDGSFELAAELYESAGPLRYANRIAAAALRAWVDARSESNVRVLEVGAGTGGTTSSLLPVLPPDRASYDYSDVSPAFLEFGAAKFCDVPFLRTRLFDLELEPAAQGVEAGSYDVVVGSNVLHAVRDLRVALRRVRELLAPGGLLLLVESTGHHAWHDITTGLMEGWQHFDDGIRTDTPLLPPERWRELLLEAGFVAVEAAPEAGSRADVLKQHVILAAAPAVTEPVHATRGQEAPDEARTGTTEGELQAGATAPDQSNATANVATQRAAADQVTLADRLNAAVGSEREELVIEVVRGCVMEVLRSDPGRPPARDARLMELGVDSLMAVRLRNLVQERLGLKGRLPSTLVFDYPTIRQIARLAISLEQIPPADGPTAKADRAGDPGAERERERERQVAGLSDAEVEALLLDRLAAEEGA